MSRFPIASSRPRLAVLLSTVLAVVTLGASLAQAAEETTSAASAKPKSTTVPPIVSPRTDQAPQMPAGSPGTAPPAELPSVDGRGAPVVPPAAAAPPVTLGPPSPVTKPMPEPAASTGFVAGRSVEATSKRTATTKTFVNPDGTNTAQVFNRPVHMRDPGSGAWVDINMNLSGAGGRLRSTMTPAGVDLASRSNDPSLARLSLDAAHSVSFSLAGASNTAATVSNEKATYSGVLPGVDLRLSAKAEGLKEEIVLASKEAPDTFVFPLALQGLTASIDPASGDVVYRDGSGAELGRTPHGWMKDSNVDPRSNEPAQSFGVTYDVVDDGSGGQALRVTLDRAWLNAPERKFPVVVDPSYYWNSTTLQDDTFVMSNAPADNAWDGELKVGTYDGGTHLAHSYMNFNVAGLNNTHILSAVFNVYETWSWSCQPRGMGVYRVTQPWGGHTMTTYPGASYGEQVAWAAFAMGYSGACPAGWASWDITGTVHNWTHGIWGQYGLMMREDTVSTTDNYAWKKFLSWDGCGGGSNWCLPHIDIQYNTPPNMAVPVAPSPGNGAQIHSQSVTLAASASDPNGDQVNYLFQVCTGADAESGSCWDSGWSPQSSYDLVFPWNTTYYWHVYTWDGTDVTDPNWVWSFRPYENAPTMATPNTPGNGANVHTLTPALSVSASDADGDPIQYYFRVTTGTDPNSGIIWNSEWQSSSSLSVPAGLLNWNTTYYWRAYTYDGIIQTDPNWARSFRTSNAAPPTPALTSPAAGAVLGQTNLSFGAGAVSDPDGDAVKYQFQVATGTDGQSGRLALSQWLSTPSWTPPAGTFADGGSYSWVVRAQDDRGDFSSSTSLWSSPRAVKVDFRLGQKPTLPYDTQGPAAVNLSNGNLIVSVAGPSFPTVGGPVGVGFTYNSQAPALRGLTGDYYQDLNANGVLDAGEPRLLHRIDPQLSFEWGSPGEGPNSAVLNPERWIGRWTGGIRVPAGQDGSWVFVTDRNDDSVKVRINGNEVLSAGITNQPIAGTPVTLSSTSSAPIAVDYVQVTGPQYMRLKIRKVSDPNTAAFEIPSDWLTPTQPGLPDGWSRSGDAFAQVAFTSLRPVNGSTTAVVDASGADHLYTWSGSGWKPPAGENGILTQRADGSWSLLGDDGYLYRFSVEGRLTDITSPADDLHPGAPTYSYTTPNPGGPTRLTRITDATGRKADLTYGPSTSCPTVSGFDSSAPADMLCKVAYSDYGGGATELYYSNGHLARLVTYSGDPGAAIPKGETIDFGYNADGLLTQIRDVLTNDLIAAGVFTDPTADRHKWLVGYDTDPTPTRRKVVSVKAPVADATMADPDRPSHSFVYTPASGLPTQTELLIAGGNGPSGYARRFAFDSDGHTVADTGADGVTVETVWDTLNDRPIRKIDHHYQADPAGGLVTTYFYDPAGRLTDTYGPAPLAEFDQQTWRSTTAPRSTSGYDEGINGLAAAWFDNNDLAATPKAHTTLVPDVDWGNGSPAAGIPADNFSGRLTGEVTLAAGAPLTLDADGARVVVDDQTLLDTWAASSYPDIIKSDAPTGYWKLDETSGTAAANTMGGTAGTITGAVTLGQAGATGDGRTAYSFNGGHISLPGGYSDFSQGLTIEAWVKPTGVGNFARIVDLGNGQASDNIVFMRRGTTNTLSFEVLRGGSSVGYVDAPNALVLNTWQHVAVTMTATGAVTIYRNGLPVASGTIQTPNPIWRTSNFIAKSNWGSDALFAGLIDDVAIYPHVTVPGRAAARVGAATGTTPTQTTTNVATGTHRVRVDYQERTGNARLRVTAAGATFKPRYNLLTSATDPDGKVTTHEYLPEVGLETATVTDPAGANLRTTTGYEAAGTGYYRRLSRTLPAGNATTYAYYGQGTNPATADNPCPGGAAGINQGGALWKTTSPDPDGAGPDVARVEESIYDAAGRPVASRIGTEAWTCITYDHRGRVLTKTIPAFDASPARTITHNYAAFDPALGSNNPAITTVSDPAGTITTRVDWLGRVVAYTDVWGNTTTTTYDQAGRVTDTAGPGGTFHTDYDPAGRPSAQKLDGAVVATATYDPASGVLTDTSYPTGTGNGGNGTSGSIVRDNRGRLATLNWKKSDGTTLTSNSVTRSSAGDVIDETINGVDPNPSGANFTYDGAGRLTDAWVPGHRYTYSFAATGGCGSQTNAGLNTNRTATTDNGAATTYCYDATDRLTSTSDPRYGSISYDAHGNTKTIGGQALGYDNVDRHLTTSYGTPAAQTTVSYTRDATDRITSRTVSSPGTVTFRAAAGANNGGGATTLAISRPAGTQPGDVLLAQITTAATTGTVTAPAGWTLHNSTTAGTNVRDLLYWRVAATNDPASWTWTFASSTKASGGITGYAGVDPASPINASAVTTSGSGTSLVAPSVATTKDNTMVVAIYGTRTGTTITAPAGMSERYDQASTGQSAASRTTSAAVDQLRTTAGATGTRIATAAASVTASVNRTIALNPAPVVTIARYGYTTSGDSPDLILDAGGGVMERTFVFLGQVLLTKRGAGDAVWSYPNIHGDVTATTDGTGTQTGSFSYDPYGQALGALPDNATDNLDYGWLGQHQRPLEHEGTLATIEMGDRQYIPGLGRFIEVDPVEGGNDNPYEYCSADPINCTDLDGQLSLKKLVKKIRTVARVVALVPGPIGTVAGGVAAGASLAIGDWNGLATDAAFMAAGAVGGRALAQFGKTRGLAGAQQGLKGVGVNSRLFGRHNQGILNSNDVIRLGWSWRGSASNGYNSFGLRLGSKRGPIHWHFPIV